MRYLILIFLFTCFQSFSQDSVKHRKVKVLPVPAFGYTPETKAYVGAVSLFYLDFYNDGFTRSSNAKIEFNYTWKKQIILEGEWNYFFKDEKWFTQGFIHYSKYSDFYYGIGATRRETDEISFESNRFTFEVNLLKNISEKWFVGGEVRHINYYNFEIDPLQKFYPELRNESRSGIGYVLLNDKRNNLLTPTNGSFFRLNNNFNIGSTFYSQIGIDARKYHTIGKKDKQILSGRVYSKHILGEAPFQDIALMGGDRLVRGYLFGRFRDKNFSTLQLEYRAHLFWRIGAAAFGGLSFVYNNFNNFTNDTAKPNGGIGLRFLVDKQEGTNLRFDYAIGVDGQSGFYVSFGESF